MDSNTARGGERAKCVLGNYVDRYSRVDGARGVAPIYGSMEGSGGVRRAFAVSNTLRTGPIWWIGRK